MMRAITYQYELHEDRTIIVQLPEDILPGKHQIIVLIDEKRESDKMQDGFDILLHKTSGLWQHGDGLEYQIGLRNEWA